MNLLQLLVAFPCEKLCEITESFTGIISFFQVSLIFHRPPDLISLIESRECTCLQLSRYFSSFQQLAFVIFSSAHEFFNYEAYGSMMCMNHAAKDNYIASCITL